MKKQKTPKSRFLFYIVLILVVLGYRYYQQQQQKTEKEPNLEYVIKQNEALKNQEKATQDNKKYQPSNSYSPTRKSNKSTGKIASIEEMTDAEVVINFIKKHGALPNYYITKNEARKKGWDPAKGNLCDVLPGKAIGGDHFGNFENRLPNKKGRKYKEADINYNCGHRQAKRLIFSNDGLIYTTDDHYNTFTKH